MAELEKLLCTDSRVEAVKKINAIIENGADIDSEILDQFVAKDSLVEVQTVIETYVNGTSWCRVWSDGWCEQGGIYTGSSAGSAVATINLLKTYKDTNYCITATKLTDDSGNTYYYGLRLVKAQKTTTSFQARPDSTGGMMWQACGYLW